MIPIVNTLIPPSCVVIVRLIGGVVVLLALHSNDPAPYAALALSFTLEQSVAH